MPNRKRTGILAAAIVGLLASPALVQAADQDKPAANPAASAEPTTGGMPMHGYGMMGQGMMGQGMMGQGMGMMGGRHVEGRIAFLKTELKITEAQQKLWDAVADAMRANAKAMTTMRGGMMQTGAAASLPDRLAAAEKLLDARLDALRKYKAAVDPLYAALSDQQKESADELMPPMMGMGMGGGGMMNGGMMGRMGSR